VKNKKFQILEIDTFLPLSIKFISEMVKGRKIILLKALNTIHSTTTKNTTNLDEKQKFYVPFEYAKF